MDAMTLLHFTHVGQKEGPPLPPPPPTRASSPVLVRATPPTLTARLTANSDSSVVVLMVLICVMNFTGGPASQAGGKGPTGKPGPAPGGIDRPAGTATETSSSCVSVSGIR